jgi:peptidoglycan/xylan/chitin deacetylase (PgdA/CDA1 family)
MKRFSAFSVLSSPFARRFFRPLMRNRATIFYLHRLNAPHAGIHGHSVEFLRAALQALRDSGARFVSLRTMIEAWNSGRSIGPDWVAFTMDDGFADQEILFREAFAPMDCPATIFLISGFLDHRLWPWDDQLSYVIRAAKDVQKKIELSGRQFALDLSTPRGRAKAVKTLREHCKATSLLDPYEVVARVAAAVEMQVPLAPPEEFRAMSWEAARGLERDGVDFGPHSISHRIFSRLSDADAHAELATSWQRLQAELKNPLPVFAWPTGRRADFGARDMALARALGLQAAVSTIPDFAHVRPGSRADDLFALNRFALPDAVDSVLRYGSWLERGRQLLPV